MLKNRISAFLSLFAFAALVSACSSSERNPGFTIYSTPDDFKVNVGRVCDLRYEHWLEISNIPIRPDLGTSKIKQILSAIHNLGLVYWSGCPSMGLEQDRNKAFIILQLTNDFEYIPTRFFFGKELISGEVISKDISLGLEYLLQVIRCDYSLGKSYRREADHFLQNQKARYHSELALSADDCNQIPGSYFKGPSVEFDAIAFKVDWESRSDKINESWSWLGASFRGATAIVREAIPIALAGVTAYYAAKSFGGYAAIPEYSNAVQDAHTQSFPNNPASPNIGSIQITNSKSESQISTTGAVCTSDFQCGTGKVCVKPRGSLSLKGFCGTLVDEFGLPQFTVPSTAVSPREIAPCNFDTECQIGYRCKKMNFELVGVCVR